MTEHTTALQRLAEHYVTKELRWHEQPAPEPLSSIVIANIRGFAAWVAGLSQDELNEGEDALIEAAWKRHEAARSAQSP